MSVIAAYKFENNGTDEMGSYNLNVTGTPYKSSSPSPYEGSYCAYGNSTNYQELPSALQTALSGASAFTFQYYINIKTTGGIETAFDRKAGTNPGGFGMIHDWTDANKLVVDFNGWWNTIIGITNNSWERITVTWTGSLVKVWWNTTKFSGDWSRTTNPFSTNTTTDLLRIGIRDDNSWPLDGGIDRLIICDTSVSDGNEITIPSTGASGILGGICDNNRLGSKNIGGIL